MFVLNFKLSGRKKAAAVFAAVLAVAVIIALICLTSKLNGGARDSATCDELGTYSLKASTSSEECAFLARFGFEADENGAERDTVTIPRSFNEVYEKYNSLQQKIGLDIEPYKGKEAERVTYTLKNSDTKYAVLLVYEGRIIGAHLTNGEYGGENLPLIG